MNTRKHHHVYIAENGKIFGKSSSFFPPRDGIANSLKKHSAFDIPDTSAFKSGPYSPEPSHFFFKKPAQTFRHPKRRIPEQPFFRPAQMRCNNQFCFVLPEHI
jgi:hypothetical protein